ncbi:hypothetical protein JVU11DRAFT_2699 [Chiua virens]|nr:hypothetical protein JVU11DRAFT_2699 [Chiua virens]
MFLFLFAALSSLFSLVLALPVVSPVMRDVWTPPITYPDANTEWVVGETYTVTWDTSNEPTEVTNPTGYIYLRHGDSTESNPIASGFPLTDGSIDVTVPADTQPDTDWMVVLMGDSGNWSPTFTILAASS